MEQQESIELQREVFRLASLFTEDIRSAAQDRVGMSGWFEGFLQSKRFSDLDNEAKGECFRLYENLRQYLTDLAALEVPGV